MMCVSHEQTESIVNFFRYQFDIFSSLGEEMKVENFKYQ